MPPRGCCRLNSKTLFIPPSWCSGLAAIGHLEAGGDFADTRPKLQALARYAELYGDHYVDVESLVKVGDQLRVLDLHDPAVPAEVMEFDGAQGQLYEGHQARAYR